MKRSVAVLATASMLLMTAACGGSDDDTTEDGLRALKVAPTVPGPLYWSFYWSADALGFYEDEGLDVEIIPVEASVPQAILSGQLDIGGVGSDFIPQGADLEELNWFMMTDAYLFQALVPGDSEFTSVADLAGKKIGINDPHDEFDAEFILTSNGIERGDYELVPTGEAVQNAQAVLDGQVDAIINPVGSGWLQINEAFPDAGFRILENPGTEGFYNTGLITTDEMIEDERDTVVAFGRAIAKAMIWMHENPELTAEKVLEVEPNAAESVEEAVAGVTRAAEFNTAIYDERGEINVDIIQDEIDLTASLGLLEETYDAEAIIDTSLWEEIWDFDVEAEIEAARAGEL